MKKRFLLWSTLVLTTALLTAQNAAINGFVNKYKDAPAFTYTFISKKSFQTLLPVTDDAAWKKLENVIKNLGSLTILAADSIKNGQALYKEILPLIPEDEFSTLLTVRDGSDHVRIWSKDDGDVVTDLILLVGAADNFVLVCFSGNLELGNINELVNMLNINAVNDIVQTTERVAIDFKISPNPSQGDITLTYSDEKDVPANLTVVDQNGRQVASRNLSAAAVQPVSLGDLPAGLYWLQMQTQNGQIGTKQVQIMR